MELKECLCKVASTDIINIQDSDGHVIFNGRYKDFIEKIESMSEDGDDASKAILDLMSKNVNRISAYDTVIFYI